MPEYLARRSGKNEDRGRCPSHGPGEVKLMELDMSTYSSCVAFVDELKRCCDGPLGLDVAVLNAGSITPEFTESPEGW